MRLRRVLIAAGAVIAAIIAVGQVLAGGMNDQSLEAVEVGQVRVLEDDSTLERAGYDRECGSGHGCVFGQRWSDDVDVDGGHNGCDTRNDLLAAAMTDITYKPGTNRCVVLSGTMTDPYSQTVIEFRRPTSGQPASVEIDHI